jgi:hypothetical protein
VARGTLPAAGKNGGTDADRAFARRSPEDRLMTRVSGIAITEPDFSLREVTSQLEKMWERTPRGGR